MGGGDSAKTEDKQQVTPSGENKDKNEGAAVPAASIKEATEGDKATARKNVPEETNEPGADGPAKDPTDMEYEQNSTPVVVKRPLEVDQGNDNGAAYAGEPLPKAPFVRRPTLKIQPKVPPDRRSASSAEKKGTASRPALAGDDTRHLEGQEPVTARSQSSREEEAMDVSGGASGTTVTKRGHDATLDAGEVPSAADLEGPPSKAVTFRRPKFKPRPSLPPDRTAAEPLPK
ncbi:hypothetical protein MTO96_050042 [Rhipicephalus appendiculatus]